MPSNLDIIREMTEKLNLRDKKLRERARALNKIRKIIDKMVDETDREVLCEEILEIKNILKNVE